MIEFSVSGTLGDTFLICLKLLTLGDKKIRVFHCTSNKYWYDQIREIYSLLPNIEVIFINKEERRNDLPIIESLSIDIKPEYFPQFDLKSNIEKPYTILLANSGKPRNIGRNTKELNPKWIQDLIDIRNSENTKVVLISTNRLYESIQNCINLTNKTSVLEAISIVSNAKNFIGPAGLLSYVALSQKIKSVVFCGKEDIQYIKGTPWEKYCKLEKL